MVKTAQLRPPHETHLALVPLARVGLQPDDHRNRRRTGDHESGDVMKRFDQPENCDCCGRFVSCGKPGTSWSQDWSYDLDGCPTLHDPRWRCSECTAEHGPRDTNCAYPERYSGIVQAIKAVGVTYG